MNYAVIASTFSGNKGATSMLEASIQTITKQDKNAKFSVFTVYPEQDKKFNAYSNVTLLNGKPLYLGLVINPLTLLYKVIPPLRPLLRKNAAVNALAEADVLLDQGGITFVDGRTKFLIYNVATLLPGLFTNTKVIKCSQAMGPFTGINRFIAKLILPKMHVICARGAKTREFLNTLGLKNVIDATDYAFLMDITAQEKKHADALLNTYKFKKSTNTKTIGVLPSEVLRKKAANNGEDYVGFVHDFVISQLSGGHQVVLMAYSARGNTDSLHNNDLPVCRDIAQGINDKNFIFIDKEVSAQQLRHIIGKMDIVVTSRFHAMIAALTMNVPPIVVGWSHKYAEIMDMFGLNDLALGSDKLESDKLTKLADKAFKDKSGIAKAITENLPNVKESAYRQVLEICKK